MKRSEINRHPDIAPLLEKWRAACAERDRVWLDRRYNLATVREAQAAATEAEAVYDAAVAALLKRAQKTS